MRSASQVLRVFNAQALTLPRRDRFGEVVWRKPTVAAILSILKHPAYAGAFTYGRTRTLRTSPDPRQARQQKLPLEQWRIRVNDVYPAYISWETYERIQALLKDNHAEYDRNKTRGVPRPGKALLHGLVYCGECGHKMVVQYKGSTRYLCNQLRQQYGVPVCQYLPADPIDEHVVQAFFAALSPVELDAYHQALEAEQQTANMLDHAHRQQLERLGYQAALAERQFNQVDPANRLVAAELERRWEAALRELKQAEAAYAQARPATPLTQDLPPELKATFTAIGQQLPALWPTERLSQPQKKALLRCLIDKVVIPIARHAIRFAPASSGGAGRPPRRTCPSPWARWPNSATPPSWSAASSRSAVKAWMMRPSPGSSPPRVTAHPCAPQRSYPAPSGAFASSIGCWSPAASRIHAGFRTTSPSPRWPTPWASHAIGSMIGFTTARSSSLGIRPPVFTCFRIDPIPYASSDASGPENSNACGSHSRCTPRRLVIMTGSVTG